jgi:flagellar FliJ protein
MSRSKRMQPVQRVAHGREEDAMHKLGQSQRFLDAQQARLEELRAYRDQYSREFAASGESGLDASRVRDYRAFLSRLGEAIQQQEVLVARYQSQHEQTRQRWVESRSHSQAIDKVVDRYRRQERQQQERREQLEHDERAQRTPRK